MEKSLEISNLEAEINVLSGRLRLHEENREVQRTKQPRTTEIEGEIIYLTDEIRDLRAEKGRLDDRLTQLIVNEASMNSGWIYDRQSTYAKMWKAICEDNCVKVDGKIWVFRDQSLSWPSQVKGLYERSEYTRITNNILSNDYSCVYITGTSGIGKSLYLWYLIIAFVEKFRQETGKTPTILYKTRVSESYLLLPNGAVQVCTLSVTVLNKDVPNIVLLDSLDAQTVESAYGMHVLVGSNTKHFKEYQKRVDEHRNKGMKFYMDVWSPDELQAISEYDEPIF